MQHVHYDLSQIEAETRKMYADLKPGDVHEIPAVAEVFRRAVDIEVAAQRWILTEIMNGTPSDIMMEALISVICNLTVNRLRHFNPDPGHEHPALQAIMIIAENCVSRLDAIADPMHKGNGPHVDVNGVVSGRA